MKTGAGISAIALLLPVVGCASGRVLPRPSPSWCGAEPVAVHITVCSEPGRSFSVGYDAGLYTQPTPTAGNPFASITAEESAAITDMVRSRSLRTQLEPFAVTEFRLDQCGGADSVVIGFGDGAEFVLPQDNAASLPRGVTTLLSSLQALSVKYFHEPLLTGTRTQP